MGITDLSLFDGISCCRVSLERLKIAVDKYYASEIDEKAIQITQNNFPDTIQIGDINNINIYELPKIDLIAGGSPCQGFSIAGKKENFKDERSNLLFKFVEILNILRPKYFLFENVATMGEEIADFIDSLFNIKRKFIDAVNFTGMHSKRYYWTNIPFDENKIIDANINAIDIIDTSIQFHQSLEYLLSKTIYNPSVSTDGIITINPRQNNGKQTWQRGRVYDIKGKLPRSCATLYDLCITENHKFYRKLTFNEIEKFFGLPINYTYGIDNQSRGKCLGNGWSIDVVTEIFKNIKITK